MTEFLIHGDDEPLEVLREHVERITFQMEDGSEIEIDIDKVQGVMLWPKE